MVRVWFKISVGIRAGGNFPRGQFSWNRIKRSNLYNISRGEKSMKKKMKIKTQNEKIVVADMNI